MAKNLSTSQAGYAKKFLAGLKTKADRQKAARRIAESEGIKYDSAMRRLQRYTTETGKQKRDLLKSPKVGKVIEGLPRGGHGGVYFPDATLSVRGKIQYSSEKRKKPRTVRFDLKGHEVRKVLEAPNEAAAAQVVSSIDRFGGFTFFDDARVWFDDESLDAAIGRDDEDDYYGELLEGEDDIQDD